MNSFTLLYRLLLSDSHENCSIVIKHRSRNMNIHSELNSYAIYRPKIVIKHKKQYKSARQRRFE